MMTKKLTLLALFTAVAVVIHVVEALIPLPVPVPGVKLGFANIVTLFMLFWKKEGIKTADVFVVLLCRIVLGALIAGRPIAVVYSLAGGLFAFAAQIIMRRFVSNKQMWACGAVGAVFHNVGQIAAAMVLTGTPGVAVYLPVLIIAGVFAGAVTGLIAGYVLGRLSQNANNA